MFQFDYSNCTLLFTFKRKKITIVIFFLGDIFPMLKDIFHLIWHIYSGSPARYSRRITSERNERMLPPPLSFASLPFSLRLSHSPWAESPSRLGQCQNSGAVRRDGNPSWSEFPTPTRPCACHIPAQQAARARRRACTRACAWTSVCVASDIRARTRVLLDVRISICLECIVSYVLNEHSAALMYSRTRAHICSCGCVAKTARRYILQTSEWE